MIIKTLAIREIIYIYILYIITTANNNYQTSTRENKHREINHTTEIFHEYQR